MISKTRFAFAICLSFWAHSLSFASTESAAHPLERHTQHPPLAPMHLGEAGPVAESAYEVLRPSTTVADQAVVQPPAATAKADKSLRKTPLKVKRTRQDLPPAKGWFGWVALGASIAALALQIAAIIVGIIPNWSVLAALMIGCIVLGITAIALGAVSVTDRSSRAYTPGFVGLLIASATFVWPCIALIIAVLVTRIFR